MDEPLLAIVDYYEYIFPSKLMWRLVAGAVPHRTTPTARHLAVTSVQGHWRHFRDVVVTSHADLIVLLCYEHRIVPDDAIEPPRLSALQIRPARAWACSALHMGWAIAPPLPLLQGHSAAHASNSIIAEEYFEIVFDFDLPQVDEVASECGLPIREGFLCDCARHKQGCCSRCWLLVRLARVCLDHLAPEDWGPPLWVYSGGKGAHCIYGSAQARAWTRRRREILCVAFLDMQTGRGRIPDTLAKVLLDAWVQLGVKQQNILASDRACELLANAFLTGEARDVFMALLSHEARSVKRWAAFARLGGATGVQRVLRALCMAPFDVNPLRNRRACIKCPFALHSTTRRVALPLPDVLFEHFDPQQSPSLGQLTRSQLETQLRASAEHLEAWLNTNHYAPLFA